MIARRVIVTWLVVAAAASLAACESTQDKSRRLAKEGAKSLKGQKGVVVTKASTDVAVASTSIIATKDGSVGIVELRNRSNKAFAKVPLSIAVGGAGGKSLYRNNIPGLQDALTGPASLGPKQSITWVNDQIGVLSGAKTLKALAGEGKLAPAPKLPVITLTKPALADDEVNGLEATGKATNKSTVLQRMLFIYAVARRNGKAVAAGRGAIEALKPGKSKSYSIFFIGNPRGAQIELYAPPTVLR